MFPRNNHGLNPDEITLPELLKGRGYATAIVGNWHLGNDDMFQPLNHGFDYWYGTPSSNSQFYYPTIKKYAAECVFREGYTRNGILTRETAACPRMPNGRGGQGTRGKQPTDWQTSRCTSFRNKKERKEKEQ